MGCEKTACEDKSGDVVVEIALGDGVSGAGLADARLLETNPRLLRDVVRFGARRQLPVGVWLVTGLWRMPVRVEQVARWVDALARDAGEATVWIDTGREGLARDPSGRADARMPAHFERRLVGHLRGLGCQVTEDGCSQG
jgi:hypothetical protein